MAPQTIVFVLEGDLMYEGSKKLVARKGDILGEEWLIKSNKDKRYIIFLLNVDWMTI